MIDPKRPGVRDLAEHKARATERESYVEGGLPTASGGGVAAEFFVHAVFDNHLSCVRVGDATLTPVLIAKYPAVRRQEYDGKTLTDPVSGVTWTYSYSTAQTRTVTRASGATQQQAINPRYLTPAAGAGFTGSRIVAVQAAVTVAAHAGGGGQVVCTWVEVTNRAYARRFV